MSSSETQQFLKFILNINKEKTDEIQRENIEVLFIDNCIKFHHTFFIFVYFELCNPSYDNVEEDIIQYLKTLLKTYSLQYFTVKNNTFGSTQSFVSLLSSLLTKPTHLKFLQFLYDSVDIYQKRDIFNIIGEHISSKTFIKSDMIDMYNILGKWDKFREFILSDSLECNTISTFKNTPLNKLFTYTYSNKTFSTSKEKFYKLFKSLCVHNKPAMVSYLNNIIKFDNKRNTESYVIGLINRKQILPSSLVFNIFINLFSFIQEEEEEESSTEKINFIENKNLADLKYILYTLYICNVIPYIKRLEYLREEYKKYANYVHRIMLQMETGTETDIYELESHATFLFKQNILFLSNIKQQEDILCTEVIYDIYNFSLFCIEYIFENIQEDQEFSKEVIECIPFCFDGIIFYDKQPNTYCTFLEKEKKQCFFIAERFISNMSIHYLFKRYILEFIAKYTKYTKYTQQAQSLDLSYIINYFIELKQDERYTIDNKDFAVQYNSCFQILKNCFEHLDIKNNETFSFNCIDVIQNIIENINNSQRKLKEEKQYVLTPDRVVNTCIYETKIIQNHTFLFTGLEFLNLYMNQCKPFIVENHMHKLVSMIVHTLLLDYIRTVYPHTYLLGIDICNIFCSEEKFYKVLFETQNYSVIKRLFSQEKELLDKINDYRENKMWMTDNISKIDSQFLDPIMFTLIEKPLLLPNTNLFVDLEHIRRHLTTHPFDPFTKQPLTFPELIQFNETEEISEKVKEFKKELDNHIQRLKKEFFSQNK